MPYNTARRATALAAVAASITVAGMIPQTGLWSPPEGAAPSGEGRETLDVA